MPDEPVDEAVREENTDQEDPDRTTGDSETIGFSLPPITLPPLRLPSVGLPADFSPIPPVFERVRGSENLVLAALAIDAIDIVVIFGVGGGFARVMVVAILTTGLVYPLGVLSAWEFLPVLAGLPWVGIIPSATLVVFLDRYHPRAD